MLQTFSLRKKIFLSFFILILIYLIIAMVGYYQISQVKALSEEVVPYSLQMSSLHEFAVSLESLERAIDKFFVVGYVEYHERANKDLEHMSEVLKVFKKDAYPYSIPRLIALEKLISELQTDVRFLTVPEQGQVEAGEINEKIISIYEQIRVARQKYGELLSETTNQIHTNVTQEKKLIFKVLNQLVILGIAVLVVGILMSLLLSTSITKPISKLKSAATEIGKGKLDTKIDVKSKDEIGELASSFKQMTRDLRKSREKIKKHEKELESLVEKRTKELNKKVKELEDARTATLNMLEDVSLSKKKLEESQRDLLMLNKRLEDANVELKRLDKYKNEFISITAHELKTPLASIHGFADLLQKKKISSNVKQRDNYLKIIMDDANRLKKLIDDIIDLSRLDLGTMKFFFEKVSVKEMFRKLVKELYLLAAKRGLTLRARVADDVPAYTNTDNSRLFQILTNLVNNAIKYTPKRGGKINVYASKQGNKILFSVKDTGIGISKKHFNKIFDRFYQADSAYTRKALGSGLGLAICKGMIEALGGKIWVKSGIGKGTTFSFTIPIKRKAKGEKELEVFKRPEEKKTIKKTRVRNRRT